MRLRFGVIEPDQSLAFVYERRLVALRESLERKQLEHRLPWRARDLPAARDEAVDEERRPDLGREDHLLLVFRRQDARSLGGVVAEDRGVEARQETRWRDRIGRRAGRLREVEELASALVTQATDVLDPRERGADVRHLDLAPGADVLNARGTKCPEVTTDDEVVCRVVADRALEACRRRLEARQLAVLEVRAGGLPDESVRGRDRGEEKPAPHALVF